MRRPPLTRFMEKIAVTEGPLDSPCWVWTAYRLDCGYGQFGYQGAVRLAHRVGYMLFVGEIPDGLELDHLCRVRACVNPTHLDPVTHSENVRRGLVPESSRSRQLALTHCPQGHPYAGENLYVDPLGRRRCRDCMRANRRRSRENGRRTARTVDPQEAPNG